MDFVEILKMGLPGLVFLLSLFSYRLLSREQHRTKPSLPILKSIRQFMYINILLAILTMSAPVIESNFLYKSSAVFSVEAKLSGTELEKGQAAVCSNAKYSGRYILITDQKTTRMVQVKAVGILPCSNAEFIAINSQEATDLGWTTNNTSTFVEVSAAGEGQMYVLQKAPF